MSKHSVLAPFMLSTPDATLSRLPKIAKPWTMSCHVTHTLHWYAGQLFGWELVISFILVSTVYACAIGSPNFGERAHHPLSLQYTGHSVFHSIIFLPVVASVCFV